MKKRFRKNRSSGDSKRYEDWFECAETDLLAAEKLARGAETLKLAAFHVHQALEKTFKGLILYRDGTAADGHNLVYLCRRAASFDKAFNRWLDECIETGNFYIQTRYPADFPLVLSRAKVDRIFAAAEEALDYAINSIYTEITE